MSHQATICQVSYGFLRRSLVTLGFSTLDFSTMPFVVRFTVSCGFSTTGFLGRFTVPCGSFFSSRSGSAKIPPSICSDADRSTSPPGCPELSAPLAADASLCCVSFCWSFFSHHFFQLLLPLALFFGTGGCLHASTSPDHNSAAIGSAAPHHFRRLRDSPAQNCPALGGPRPRRHKASAAWTGRCNCTSKSRQIRWCRDFSHGFNGLDIENYIANPPKDRIVKSHWTSW